MLGECKLSLMLATISSILTFIPNGLRNKRECEIFARKVCEKRYGKTDKYSSSTSLLLTLKGFRSWLFVLLLLHLYHCYCVAVEAVVVVVVVVVVASFMQFVIHLQQSEGVLVFVVGSVLDCKCLYACVILRCVF